MAFGFLSSLAMPVGAADGFPGAITQATSGLDDRRVINIAPVGVNLGEMLAPFMQGGTPGTDYAPPSRWVAPGAAQAPAGMPTVVSSGAPAALALVAGAAILAGAGLAIVLWRR
jgi:hypothetical protein